MWGQQLDIDYVAFDSFGIKSMCVKVETKDCSITIDPGIAGEVGSFPLPSYVKAKLYMEYKGKIKKSTDNSDVVIITHYHYDHHICEKDERLYKDKLLLIKDPENSINKSQSRRSANFLEKIKGLPRRIRIADGKEFKIGKTRISFSKALWHGVRGTNLGYVIMAKVTDGGEKLLYSSDVDGPVLKGPTDKIIKESPDVLILDGPPTYLLGFIMAYYNLARSIINITRILEECNFRLMVLDHHLVRDYRYPDLLFEVYKKASELGKNVKTAAEVLGRRTKVLEGYEKYGPTRWKKWKRFEKRDMFDVLGNAVKNDLIGKEWLKMLKSTLPA